MTRSTQTILALPHALLLDTFGSATFSCIGFSQQLSTSCLVSFVGKKRSSYSVAKIHTKKLPAQSLLRFALSRHQHQSTLNCCISHEFKNSLTETANRYEATCTIVSFFPSQNVQVLTLVVWSCSCNPTTSEFLSQEALSNA